MTEFNLKLKWVSPTYIATPSSTVTSLSWTDLIFTDQPVHPSLHSHCHHVITYYKLHLNTEYNRANDEAITKSIESVN